MNIITKSLKPNEIPADVLKEFFEAHRAHAGKFYHHLPLIAVDTFTNACRSQLIVESDSRRNFIIDDLMDMHRWLQDHCPDSHSILHDKNRMHRFLSPSHNRRAIISTIMSGAGEAAIRGIVKAHKIYLYGVKPHKKWETIFNELSAYTDKQVFIINA